MKKIYTRILFAALASILAFTACSNEDDGIELSSEDVVLSSSDEIVVLDPTLGTADVLSYEWTTGSNRGTGCGIAYTFEMCVKGDDFGHPYTKYIGRTNYRNFSFICDTEDSESGSVSLYSIIDDWQTSSELSDEVKPVAGMPCTLQARVKAMVYDSDIEPVYSNVVEVEIVPAVYVIGSSLPGGWNLDKALRMQYKGDNVYYIKTQLDEGEIKLPSGTPNFDDCYVASVSDFEVSDNCEDVPVLSEDGTPDNKFVIKKASWWEITLDISAPKITFTYDDTIELEPQSLYLVGPATGNGWYMPTEKYALTATSYTTYTYSARMLAGEFKLLRNTDSWNPAYTAAGTEDNTNMLYGADTDYKFVIDRTAVWTLSVDTEALTISYSYDDSTVEDYTSLWMIGSATSGGWSNSESDLTSMTDMGNNVFTWTGDLVAGEFKFMTVPGHWSYCYGVSSTDSDKLVYNLEAGTDNKITVATDGNYTVTADLSNLTWTLTEN
ncbi:MAG: SusF/SusE family outer membrane protein [Bacteroidales bacterium]|nr:SusF/SusE family outer membrane protein [Bacteroidales bacterium]